MIGILGGMGTQAGLDFCNKLAMLNRGKTVSPKKREKQLTKQDLVFILPIL